MWEVFVKRSVWVKIWMLLRKWKLTLREFISCPEDKVIDLWKEIINIWQDELRKDIIVFSQVGETELDTRKIVVSQRMVTPATLNARYGKTLKQISKCMVVLISLDHLSILWRMKRSWPSPYASHSQNYILDLFNSFVICQWHE